MRKTISVIFIILFMISIFGCNFFEPNDVWPYYEAKVIAVIDGDTIKIRFSNSKPNGCNEVEVVRLIGVNTPELYNPPEYYANEARDFTNTLWNNPISIELDPNFAQRDKYGRLLAYVYHNNLCWNEQIILEGYGYYYKYFNFDSQRMFIFNMAEDEAKKNKKGIWK